MKIEFLGHGLHENNINTVGDWLCSTLRDSDYYSFVGFSAFTKMSGINRIKNDLLTAKENYVSLKFYLGIVERGTSKEALEFLIKNDIETWVYCTDQSIMFHPKIYFFRGKHNSRFILGSSNLTSAGLFDNIEASSLFEFSNKDATGNKFVRQYETYFDSIINGTDKYIQRLDFEVLNDLIESGYIVDEFKTRDDFDLAKRNKILSQKRKRRKFDKDEIGNQNTLLSDTKPSNSGDIPEITQHYLDSWEEMFELFKEHKKEFSHKGERYSVTVSRDYKNPSLYRWYRLQKIYYKNKLIDPEHEKLLKQEKFYFGDAHALWQEYKEEQKLEVLMEALIAEEDIRVNHRYEYKGVRLGTWLVGVSQANKIGKKLELRQKIVDLGFDISATSRNPVDSAKRFISDLLEAKCPDKANFQNRFNGTIRDRVDEIPEDLQQDIVDAWFLQFDEDRPLGKIRERQRDRTDEWKAFRYNKSINPEKKWFSTLTAMGDVFWWARTKREAKSRMDLIKNNFTDKEKEELRAEGFPI